jgi:hypothetical protein
LRHEQNAVFSELCLWHCLNFICSLFRIVPSFDACASDFKHFQFFLKSEWWWGFFAFSFCFFPSWITHFWKMFMFWITTNLIEFRFAAQLDHFRMLSRFLMFGLAHQVLQIQHCLKCLFAFLCCACLVLAAWLCFHR